MPLPDYPMRWMKRDHAIKEGYLPFAGFFLPHEYSMMGGFIIDLERAGREYCGVRDLKWAKGQEIFAKNGKDNGYKLAKDALPEAYKTSEATEGAIKEGMHPSKAERPVGILAEGRPAGNCETWDVARTAKKEGAKTWLETSESKAPKGESGVRAPESHLAGGEA